MRKTPEMAADTRCNSIWCAIVVFEEPRFWLGQTEIHWSFVSMTGNTGTFHRKETLMWCALARNGRQRN